MQSCMPPKLVLLPVLRLLTKRTFCETVSPFLPKAQCPLPLKVLAQVIPLPPLHISTEEWDVLPGDFLCNGVIRAQLWETRYKVQELHREAALHDPLRE